jgi:hypothetical protein
MISGSIGCLRIFMVPESHPFRYWKRGSSSAEKARGYDCHIFGRTSTTGQEILALVERDVAEESSRY